MRRGRDEERGRWAWLTTKGSYWVEVSPPFEGGVAGIADFGMFTTQLSRPGWLR